MSQTTQKQTTEVEKLDDEDLTEKQAAILGVFDKKPDMTYSAIAEAASMLLPEGESVTGSYAGDQIKQKRPQWFDEEGRRKTEKDDAEAESDNEEETVTVTTETEDDLLDPFKKEENGIDTETQPEKVTEEEFSVTLDEDKWLRLVAYLHLYANKETREVRREYLMEIVGEVTRQALEG